MSSIPKWTEDRTSALAEFVGAETPVSQNTVAEAAEQFETSSRSISPIGTTGRKTISSTSRPAAWMAAI